VSRGQRTDLATGCATDQAVLRLAARPCGVTAAELTDRLQLIRQTIYAALARCRQAGRLTVVPRSASGLLTHWFASAAQAGQWLQAQRSSASGMARKAKANRTAGVPKPTAAGKAVQRARMRLLPPPQGEPVVTAATRVTVHQRRPEPHRLDLLADPLPGVPGWGGGPPLRAGAMDFRAHQRHDQRHAQRHHQETKP